MQLMIHFFILIVTINNLQNKIMKQFSLILFGVKFCTWSDAKCTINIYFWGGLFQFKSLYNFCKFILSWCLLFLTTWMKRLHTMMLIIFLNIQNMCNNIYIYMNYICNLLHSCYCFSIIYCIGFGRCLNNISTYLLLPF